MHSPRSLTVPVSRTWLRAWACLRLWAFLFTSTCRLQQLTRCFVIVFLPATRCLLWCSRAHRVCWVHASDHGWSDGRNSAILRCPESMQVILSVWYPFSPLLCTFASGLVQVLSRVCVCRPVLETERFYLHQFIDGFKTAARAALELSAYPRLTAP